LEIHQTEASGSLKKSGHAVPNFPYWEQPGKRFATAFLDDWIRRARASGIRILQQMAATLTGYRTGLQACGFSDKKLDRLKIQAIHEAGYTPVG